MKNNLLVLIIICILILIGVLFFFMQNFNKTGSVMACEWIMKLNFDYNENPYATINDNRKKLIAIPYPYTYSEFLTIIPRELNEGYLLLKRAGCSKEQVVHELYNPHNLVFFNMTFEEYSTTYDYGSNFQEIYPRMIIDSISELYICDLEFGTNSTAEFNEIISQGELDARCEKII